MAAAAAHGGNLNAQELGSSARVGIADGGLYFAEVKPSVSSASHTLTRSALWSDDPPGVGPVAA
jgi:hypothetical protein